jgi:hypothetical protein
MALSKADDASDAPNDCRMTADTRTQLPLDDRCWAVQPIEIKLISSLINQDSIVLISGARQSGKTSLLARGLRYARSLGAACVVTDFSKLPQADLETIEGLYQALALQIAEQIGIGFDPARDWNRYLSANSNFERFVRKKALAACPGQLVWAIDDADRIFECGFASEMFGLLRSWHNERSYNSDGPWWRLTMVISYATETDAFITDPNQSPFNVGVRLALEDLTIRQIADLNMQYGLPLRDQAESARLFELVGGHPYLVRRGLDILAQGELDFPAFAERADREDGVYADHLHGLLADLERHSALKEPVRGMLRGKCVLGTGHFHQLKALGLIVGGDQENARFRCGIYRRYLAGHLT